MDVIKLLKEDHKRLKGLFSELEDTDHAGKRERLLGEIEREIEVHAKAEEALVYPAFREIAMKKKDNEMFFEAHEEHHAVELFLPELRKVDIGSETFKARATVLHEMIEHHAQEEEKEMFKTMREEMSRQELQDLGIEVHRFKADFQSNFATDAFARTVGAAAKRVR